MIIVASGENVERAARRTSGACEFAQICLRGDELLLAWMMLLVTAAATAALIEVM